MELNAYLQILEQLKDEPFREKQLRAAGIITDYVKKKTGIDLIVVGGLSVELYTDGGYATQDIDFVGTNHETILEALNDLGFKNIGGKDSIHDDLELFVEIPGSVLKDADERYVRELKTPDDFNVRIIGVEDIIKDRLRAYIHWKSIDQREWTYELIKRHLTELDIDYIKETLTDDEWEIFELLLEAAQAVDKAKQQHVELQLFMDKEGMSYTLVNDRIFALPVDGTYYGFSIYPEPMGYVIPDDADEDILEQIKEEMTFEELIAWIHQINSKHVQAIVTRLKQADH